MICCSTCGEWFHFKCIGLSKKAAEDIDEYECKECQDKEKQAEEEVRKKEDKAEEEEEYNEEGAEEEEDEEEEEEEAQEADSDAQDGSESEPEPATRRTRAAPRARAPAKAPARARTAVGKDPVRSHVLKTFTEIFAPLFASAGEKDASERATAYAEELESELHSSLGQREKGRLYKERFRTLSFNLKDQRNTSLHERITSGALSATDLAKLPNEALANDSIREAAEKAKRDALQQSVLREQADGPARKITHKGEIDIERDDAAPYVAPDPRPEMIDPAPKEPSPEPVTERAASTPQRSEPSESPARPAVNFAEAWKEATPRQDDIADPPSPGFAYAVGGETPPPDEAPFLSESHDADTALDSFLDQPTEESTTPPGTPPLHTPAGRRSQDKMPAHPVVWDGVVTMPEYTSAYVHARQLSEPLYTPTSALWPALFAGAECMVEGRLPSKAAVDYLHQVRQSPRNEIVLMTLDAGGAAPAPERHHEADPTLYASPSLDKLVRYFADKQRFGVLAPAPGMMGTLVKDFYIAPLRATDPVPDWLYTLHPTGLGPMWAESRPADILVAVLVLFRAALEERTAQDNAAPAPPSVPAPAHTSGSTPPVSLDALLNVKPDAIQNLLSTLGGAPRPPMGATPPGMPPAPPGMPPMGPGIPPPMHGMSGPPPPRPMRQWGSGAQNPAPSGWEPPRMPPGPPGPPGPFPYGAPMPNWQPSRGGWYGGNPDQGDARRGRGGGRRGGRR